MNNALSEINYRQIGSGNRVQITIDSSTVTIHGQGGHKRAQFNRTSEIPNFLWHRLSHQAAEFDPGELDLLTKSKTKREKGQVLVLLTIQNGTHTEKSAPFYEKDSPDKVKALLEGIFLAQSPLEEIFYSEHGMSEYLIIKIRRDKTEMDSKNAANEERQISFITPADYWEQLIAIVDNIDTQSLQEIKASSNSRAADMALYARFKIKVNGEWYCSESFDDNNPPKSLNALIELLKHARKESFRIRMSPL